MRSVFDVAKSASAMSLDEWRRLLAASADPLRRRTAITAPLWFTRHGEQPDLDAGFDIAAALCSDADPSVPKAVGIYLARAGANDPEALQAFLATHSSSMPAAARRIATRRTVGD